MNYLSLKKKSYYLLKKSQLFVNAKKITGLVMFLLLCSFPHTMLRAQTLAETDQYKFGVSGYIRTGIGYSEGKKTQAHFQMPGALNKFSLGNQADNYGEFEFDYTHYLNKDKSKSIDAVVMLAYYQDFGTDKSTSLSRTKQLYIRSNNLFGNGESIWVGKRYYHRQAIHLLDRQWINPGQEGPGMGIENLLHNNTNEDLKFAAWSFAETGVNSFKNENQGNLDSYTFDARWVHKPISETSNLNIAVNYSYRAKNEVLGYKTRQGFGLFSWLDYKKKYITNTTAILFRQGANISIDHWTGVAQKENSGNDNIIRNDLRKAYTLEINNNFLYDDKDKFAFNGSFLALIRDYGTAPYVYRAIDNETSSSYISSMPPPTKPSLTLGSGSMFYWLSLGGRFMYYISNQFKLSLELTHEYIHNEHIGVSGNLSKISFTPEFSLSKGFYSRPVLRPLITYAAWSDDLRGYIGTTPVGAPFTNKTSGLTYGLQFEIWW